MSNEATIIYNTIGAMTTKDVTAPPSLGRQLNFAAGAANAVVARLLAPHGLSLAQWAVLQCLWRNGSLKLSDIARLTGNDPPATSRLVDRMVNAGLVERKVDSTDRRAVTVGLAPKGEGLRQLQGVYEQVNEVLMKDLAPDERESLFSLLQRIERSGREWLADAGK